MNKRLLLKFTTGLFNYDVPNIYTCVVPFFQKFYNGYSASKCSAPEIEQTVVRFEPARTQVPNLKLSFF